MFPVGKQKPVWTVSTAHPLSKHQLPNGFREERGRRSRPLFQTPTPIWDNLSEQNAFVPRVTIQWVPSALLETVPIYLQLHWGQESSVKF